jgi:SnoaL-like domain
MDTAAAARAWVEGWTKGWADGDADAIAGLYAEGALYRSHPFREPERSARDYLLRAFADEDLVECRFGEPVVGEGRAAIEYWALLSADGEVETLAGVSVLSFGDDGLVTEQRDYWSMQPGRAEPNF